MGVVQNILWEGGSSEHDELWCPMQSRNRNEELFMAHSETYWHLSFFLLPCPFRLSRLNHELKYSIPWKTTLRLPSPPLEIYRWTGFTKLSGSSKKLCGSYVAICRLAGKMLSAQNYRLNTVPSSWKQAAVFCRRKLFIC